MKIVFMVKPVTSSVKRSAGVVGMIGSVPRRNMLMKNWSTFMKFGIPAYFFINFGRSSKIVALLLVAFLSTVDVVVISLILVFLGLFSKNNNSAFSPFLQWHSSVPLGRLCLQHKPISFLELHEVNRLLYMKQIKTQ